MKILAIETSCDETSSAIVEDGTKILSNIVASQVDFHKKYGGIVPEVASRKHIEVISPIISQVLDIAGLKFSDINAIAVTYGPGLVGSLLVGLCAAKAIAYSLKIPLIGVNHLEGHIYANFLKSEIRNPKSKINPNNQIPNFPFVCLIVSGGHTSLVLVKGHGEYITIGQTRDDAAGEVFDKIARFLNLGYPGGSIIDELSKKGDPNAIDFPRAMMNKEYGFDFSFSGIKTAVVNYVKKLSVASLQLPVEDLVASFQQAIVDVLVQKSINAAKDYKVKIIALAGGVACNSLLREQLKGQGQKQGLSILFPHPSLCTDNAAMIGSAGYFRFMNRKTSDWGLRAVSNLKL